MCLSSSESDFTLGALRAAVKKGKVDLFGRNPENGTFETVAKVVSGYFQDKDDSFVLPQVEIVHNKTMETASVRVGNDTFAPTLPRLNMRIGNAIKQE